jgi:S-adenosyl-L-methionine hydrolase (adenosine-forming)
LVYPLQTLNQSILCAFYALQFAGKSQASVMNPTIALLTDFGTEDIYVGVMKGVIRGICPQARLLDITHAIEPQHVRRAAFALLNAYRYFPAGTVFLVVVDPGVGGPRMPVAVRAGDYFFVAPDNGILSYALATLESSKVAALSNPAYQLRQVSNTFHGRDIFAPAAAHLANGVALEVLGEMYDRLVQLPTPAFSVEGRRVTGEVLDIDRFGNVITSIGHLRRVTPERLTLKPVFGQGAPSVPVRATDAVVTVHNHVLRSICSTYGEVPRGELLALVGSNSYLELASNQGNAAQRLDVEIGDRVELEIGDIDAAIRD